jgi:hypothetical protein
MIRSIFSTIGNSEIEPDLLAVYGTAICVAFAEFHDQSKGMPTFPSMGGILHLA